MSEIQNSARSVNRRNNAQYGAVIANHISRGSIDNKSELFTSSNGTNANKNALEGMLSARTADVKSDPRLT
jgi:hypothetical protein